MSHVVLLGDSIFDNGLYVPRGEAVVDHLGSILPPAWRVTLLAVDGDRAEDVALQLEKFPPDATQIVVSVGGNDALAVSGQILTGGSKSLAAHLEELHDLRSRFEGDYRAMLDRVTRIGKPAAVCTIYDAVPGLARSLHAGLSLFNDVIAKAAASSRVSLIDLRSVCTESEDYAANSPIEPSCRGGRKIAEAILRYLIPGPDAPNRRLLS